MLIRKMEEVSKEGIYKKKNRGCYSDCLSSINIPAWEAVAYTNQNVLMGFFIAVFMTFSSTHSSRRKKEIKKKISYTITKDLNSKIGRRKRYFSQYRNSIPYSMPCPGSYSIKAVTND